MSDSGKGDAEKTRYWQRTISEAVQSGISIRQFCRQRRLKESQFYWWQHKLRASRQTGATSKPGGHGRPASVALVSEEGGATDAGIELVLGDGRKLRIRKGVEEDTLRAVLAALEPPRC
jgi:hypothetical protein